MQTVRYERRINTEPEFSSLHVPMAEVKLKRLEEDILTHGIAHPLFVWRGLLIDGHKRYRICLKHNLEFPVINISFNSKFDAMEWICDSYLLRDNLTEEYRKYFIGKKFLIRLEKSKVVAGGEGLVTYRTPNNRRNIAQQIGNALNISYGTVLKYSQYATAMDMICEREPKIAEKILTDTIKVSHESITEIARLSADDLRILRKCFNDSNKDHLSHSEIWHELRWNRVRPTLPTSRKKKQTDAAIKHMPEYDPDSELSSLTLTIPAWIRIIERTLNTADFLESSESARAKLTYQLRELAKASDFLYYYIREASYEHQ